jgi:hypothetical protein
LTDGVDRDNLSRRHLVSVTTKSALPDTVTTPI